MIQGLLGRKLGMTQIFDETGVVHPVTVVEAGPCVVTQIKTAEKDGYGAVQLGLGLDKRLNKPEQGHRQASGFMSRTLREIRADDPSEFAVGQVLTAEVFAAGETVDVTGTSKGARVPGGRQAARFPRWPQDARSIRPAPGAGVDRVERNAGPRLQGFADGRAHGTRAGDGAEPPGAAGRPERNLLLIEGSVPGPTKGLVVIRRAVKAKKK
jgi:large subunit ribosomal protein L3